ncbi:MAG: hypothetical protein R2911_01030 [Caldilineaceae bacterium]
MSSQVGNNNIGDFMLVNGNYGFTDIITDVNGLSLPQAAPIAPGDYLIQADSPLDANGRPSTK